MVKHSLTTILKAEGQTLTRRPLLVWILAVTMALLGGLVAALGNLTVAIAFVGLLVAMALAPSRNAVFWFVVVTGLIIVGVAQLYASVKYARYIVPLVSGFLLLHAVIEYLVEKKTTRREPVSEIVWWALAFMVLAILSTAVNWAGVGNAITGLKGYFQVWSLFFALALIRWDEKFIDVLPKALLAIAFVQLPFVLHEYFVIVPRREMLGPGIVAVDIVAGTFGANEFGGGANAALTVFLFSVIACLLGIWKRGAMSTRTLIVMTLVLIFPVFINETKISALYLPMVIGIVFYRDIIERPGRFIAMGSVAFGVLAALLTALALFQPSGKIKNWQDLITFTIERQTASAEERGSQYSELSRVTALTFWAEEHVHANPVNTLFGHGLGASRVQESGLNLGTSLAESRYGGMQIGYTAISSMLWDTGLIGCGLILGMFYAAFRTSGRLARLHADYPVRAGVFDGLRAAFAILALSLAHKDFFVSHIPFQTLILLLFGYLVAAEHITRRMVASRSSVRHG